MEDPKSKRVESREPHMTTTTTPPPHGASPPQKPTCLPRQNQTQKQTDVKKRKLSNTNMEKDSPYFKIRALLQQLRPHFIEVLQTPDFRNCKAADEIQKQVKLLIALNKQMTMDTGTQKKFASEHQQHSSHTRLPAKENKDGLATQQVQPRCSVEKQLPSAKWTHYIPDKKSFVSSQLPGSYIVGGSVFGWNFITFSGSKPVYYGVTKEAYRSSHIRSGDASMLSTDGSSGQGRPSM
ncbi:uncharacterized protein LOC133718869 [Rosa rugosa]|uniref:uncharacterized protein LOC133718869 n=1 Tax=Rosa rugosa TaxID=74645 RepID=UPI002B4106DF|nr:uncharacterized protein LOC133718869 [Rosa rugosa]